MVRGRTPEEGSINRSKPTVEWIEVVNTPYTSQKGKPKLPAYKTIVVEGEEQEIEWTQDAIHWWRTISSMPHCALWSPSEWQFAKATFFLADAAFRGDVRAFGELRQREAKLGTTREARHALRIRYIEPQPEKQEAAVSSEQKESAASRRSRLSKG